MPPFPLRSKYEKTDTSIRYVCTSATDTTTKASGSNTEPELPLVGDETSTTQSPVTTAPANDPAVTAPVTTKANEKPSAPIITTPPNNDGGAIELPMIPIG